MISLHHFLAVLAVCTLACTAQEPPAREKVEKFMAAEKASALHESDNAWGQDLIDTLPGLLLNDQEQAKRYVLKARLQIAADRAAKTTSKAAEGGHRHRSNSALSAALGAALEKVEKALENEDARLPKIIGAVTEIMAADAGCGMELNISVGAHLGGMLKKCGNDPEGLFNARAFLEKAGPHIKAEWLPVLIGSARGVGWGWLRNDEASQEYLREYAGPHRELARLLLNCAIVSSQEKDAANKARAGIFEREKLPEEQRWFLDLLERKTIPPAALAGASADLLRVWPTAEPPLRYAGAATLAAAWESDVPVNAVEANWIAGSLAQLVVEGKAPADEGFAVTVRALLKAWERRLELVRAPLYGWSSDSLQNSGLPANVYFLARSLSAEEGEKCFTLMVNEAARDHSLVTLVRLSESFQARELYTEAAKVVSGITPEQLKHEAVKGDLPMHVDIKRLQLPLNAAFAGGQEAAAKATIALLAEKNDDATAWTAAAWSWTSWGTLIRTQGNQEEALRRYCVATILAHAADRYATETHGKFQPPAEVECRAVLKELKYNPGKVAMLRTVSGVETLLESFDGAWKEMPEAVRKRLMRGAQ